MSQRGERRGRQNYFVHMQEYKQVKYKLAHVLVMPLHQTWSYTPCESRLAARELCPRLWSASALQVWRLQMESRLLCSSAAGKVFPQSTQKSTAISCSKQFLRSHTYSSQSFQCRSAYFCNKTCTLSMLHVLWNSLPQKISAIQVQFFQLLYMSTIRTIINLTVAERTLHLSFDSVR